MRNWLFTPKRAAIYFGVGYLLIAAVWATWHFGGWHFVGKPTRAQSYGCTVEQEAPNGECQ